MKINGRNVGKDDITIVLGASDLKDPKNIRRGVQNLSLIDYEIHPQYIGNAYYDVSIVKVNQTILFSENVWPVCLPSEYSTDENNLEKQQGIVLGYGPVDPNSDNPDLLSSSFHTLTTNKYIYKKTIRNNSLNMDFQNMNIL